MKLRLDPYADALLFAFFALLFLFAFMAVSGCGTSRDSQTKTVERLTTSTGPIVIDTPIGQFTAQPVRHEMIRSETEVSTEQTRIDAPEVGAIVSAAAGGTPFGAIAGIVGAVTTAGAGWMAMRRGKEAAEAQRHRDQLIDSVEAARDKLPDDADEKFCDALGKRQDNDLQEYIQRRTSV